ncbi:hypothetical protein BJ742DRAFT_834222 [Cladochytrium replicatum]|nr:hypothetical protein BJ742DRAFT_834222 [Cladochytrium replicatum]
MKGLKRLFVKKSSTLKGSTITIQSTDPLSNDTKLVQLELATNTTFAEFSYATLAKLDLAGHCFKDFAPEFSRDISDGRLVIVDNHDVASALMSKSCINVEWRLRATTSSSKPLPLPLHEDGNAWMCKEHRASVHDIFISYRWHSEEKLVAMLVPYLEKVGSRRLGTEVRVFWDQRCLNDAQNFKEGFLNGLKRSRIIVYLLSAESFATLNKNILDIKEDNVLAEMEEGVELAKLYSNIRLCPVLISSRDDSGNFIPFKKLPKFDSVSQSFLEDQKVSLFSSEAFVDKVHVRPESHKTLPNTISSLFLNNCINLSPVSEKLCEIAYRVVVLKTKGFSWQR